MGWDDSDDDDDWDKADLTLNAGPSAAEAEKEQWSDEETEEERKAAAEQARKEEVKGTAHKEEKERELTKLELAIIEREKREHKEAQEEKARKKAAKEAKMRGDASALEQELMDGDGGFGGADDDFAWENGGRLEEPEIDTSGLASLQKKATDGFMPKTDADFEKYASMLMEKIKVAAPPGRRGHVVLLKALFKQEMEFMSTADCKELATMCSTSFNAKVQAEREKDKGKKKAPKKGQMTQGKATGTYNDDDDDW